MDEQELWDFFRSLQEVNYEIATIETRLEKMRIAGEKLEQMLQSKADSLGINLYEVKEF